MKFTNPWIDPRIADLPTEAAEAYLLAHGWKPLGPAANPDLLQFEGPGGEDSALVLLPLLHDHGPLLQRMIDLVAEVARFEGRWAVDVVTEMRQHSPAAGIGNGSCPPASADSKALAGADVQTRGPTSTPAGGGLLEIPNHASLSYGQLHERLKNMGFEQYHVQLDDRSGFVFEHKTIQGGPRIMLPERKPDDLVEPYYMRHVLMALKLLGLVPESNPLLT